MILHELLILILSKFLYNPFSDSPVDAALLNTFLSYRKILHDIRGNLLATKSGKSPFESSEESTLRKAAGEADTRWKNYQNYLKSIAKPNVREVTIQKGKRDTENAFTNFLGAWSKKLTPIFAKAEMKVVSLDMTNIQFHVRIRLNKDYLHENPENRFTLHLAL